MNLFNNYLNVIIFVKFFLSTTCWFTNKKYLITNPEEMKENTLHLTHEKIFIKQ